MPFDNTLATFTLVNPAKQGYRNDQTYSYTTTMFGQLMRFDVHSGFYTDLMSGPKSVKKNLGIDHTFCAIASGLHDWGYKYRYAWVCSINGEKKVYLNRKQWDRIYEEALKELVFLFYPEVDDHVVPAIYNWLRTYGWVAWYRHRIVNFFTGEE